MGVFSLLALMIGFVIVAGSIVLNGDPQWFIFWPGVAITMGGTACVAIVAYPIRQIGHSARVFFQMAARRNPKPEKAYDRLLDIARTARREGFVGLSLDEKKDSNLQFLQTGVELLADGADPDQITAIMDSKSDMVSEEYLVGEKLFTTLGTVAPMWGLLGTVIGLILMLNNVDNPELIPKSMAIAMVTTFYGIFLAALFMIPIAMKFKSFREKDEKIREMIIRGVLSIQSGDSSRIVQEKLESYNLLR